MKPYLILLSVLLACSSVQARAFSYGVFVHRVKGQVRVEVYAGFPEDDRANLTVPEAIAYLQNAPYSMGLNQIGIVAEGCGALDFAPLLKAVLEGMPNAELVYFGGFGSDSLRRGGRKIPNMG